MNRGGGLHNIMESSLPRAGDTSLVELDDHELRLIVSGLKRVKRALISDMRKQKARGWKPEPGRQDNNVLRFKSTTRLLARLELLNSK